MDQRHADEAYLQPPLPTFPQAPEGEMAWRNPDLQTPHGEMASWFPKFLQSLFPGGGNRDTAETLGNLLTFGAAIGVPGGAPKTKPHPKPVDLRKIVNDYARFVMGKVPGEPKEPDPRIVKELESLTQRSATELQRTPGVTMPWMETTTLPGIPRVQPVATEFEFLPQILSLKSEAWQRSGQTRQDFLKALGELERRGLWP